MAVKMAKAQTQVAIESYKRIVDRWQLTKEQQATILGTPIRTLYAWYDNPDRAQPDRDKIERVSYVLGIFGGLAKVYGDNANADAWLRRSNDWFSGRTPLERMLDGNVGDLAEVRRYVDRFANIIW